MGVHNVKELSFKDVTVNDKFWTKYMKLVKETVIPYQWDALNDKVEGAAPSHAIENFKIAAGEKTGEFYGCVFQDSDVAKWLETVAYSLAVFPDAELEKEADEVIDLLERAQQKDGYLNSYFTVKSPGKRWTNIRDCHELYCAGHFMEAAAAYYEATGKKKFLDIMCKYADYIDDTFGKEEGKLHGYPGHEEVELALVRLYEATKNERYLNLAMYFINERGADPNFFKVEEMKRIETEGEDFVKKEWGYEVFKKGFEYNQSQVPVRKMEKAAGHAVRMLYLCSGMTDIAVRTKDMELIEACKRLWDDVTGCQMYITGGVGSSASKESFTLDYDLPNDSSYAETCASVALVFWAQRMLQLDLNSKYADIMEKALYNGTICGMSLDGKKFFYANPLEVYPEACSGRHDLSHIDAERQRWFSCACCPPNLSRLIASIGRYIYSVDQDNIYVHLYMSNETNLSLNGQNIVLSQKTKYPWEGKIKLSVKADGNSEFGINLRLPGWTDKACIKVNDNYIDIDKSSKSGYIFIKRAWKSGDVIDIDFPMSVKVMQANPNLRYNNGKAAIQRGPVIYCIEESDNGKKLHNIFINHMSSFNDVFEEELLGGVVSIEFDAIRRTDELWDNTLYSQYGSAKYENVKVKAIPYFAWANRGKGEMRVWINEK